LTDAHADYLGVDTQAMSAFPSAGFMAMRFRLDHVFSGAKICFDDFEQTVPFGEDHPWNGLSDHSPIVGRFSISA
jgi:hypothetical protein